MAISINSCFKPSPPPSIASSPRPISLRSSPAKEVTSWPSRCAAAAAACVVVGSAVGFSSITGGGQGGVIIMASSDPKGMAPPATVPVPVAVSVKWSDKIRKCPPWRVNSLENVMPENLPRLSDRGRSDGFASYRTDAPALNGPTASSSLGYNSRCYSL
ncbi:uncharacterized protein M6B38_192070 [Iris pallida]|uniref:Uncharacterized protein n=1 Tax=Iris pallida TaxID=29817 RepID=A0AAX6EF10_IRIPA|nr:uncharacterized protein M6B38_192070 [Iris pallida]